MLLGYYQTQISIYPICSESSDKMFFLHLA